MEPLKAPERQKELTVPKRKIEIVLAEIGKKPLVAWMPPIEDILEMAELEAAHFSLSSFSSAVNGENERWFKSELERLYKKRSEFGKSPTFLARLSTFAKLAGDAQAESQILDEALASDSDEYFAHRKAENSLEKNSTAEAERLFKAMDLATDVYANLRLAFFCVQRNEITGAEAYVDQALECDPFDFRARLFEGGLMLVRREYAKAILSFRVAASENATSGVVFANMAVAHIGLKQHEKAFSCLRRAVALDPLNSRVVALFADMAAFERRDADALPSLRYYLEYEQKSAQMWARLARAALNVELIDEAIVALKRQGSIHQSGAVWNNLGVAYERNGKPGKAIAAFLHAMNAGNSDGKDYFLAARNAAQFYCDVRKVEIQSKEATLEFIDGVLSSDVRGIVHQHPLISDLYVFKLMTLARLKRFDDAIGLSLDILSMPQVADRLVVWVIGNLVGRYSMQGRASEAVPFFERYLESTEPESVDPRRRQLFYNNVAFALAEIGRIEEARRALSFISALIRKEPYPTATLGLINFRVGRVDRGIELYRAAISLAESKVEKNRIRQKLNLELARYLEGSAPERASRFLERAAKEKHGEALLAEEAEKLLALRKRRLTQSD